MLVAFVVGNPENRDELVALAPMPQIAPFAPPMAPLGGPVMGPEFNALLPEGEALPCAENGTIYSKNGNT